MEHYVFRIADRHGRDMRVDPVIVAQYLEEVYRFNWKGVIAVPCQSLTISATPREDRIVSEVVFVQTPIGFVCNGEKLINFKVG